MRLVELRVRKGRFVNYCYIIVDEAEQSCILIDPAWEELAFIEVIVRSNLTPVGVFVTHHHFDHIHLAEFFSREYGCPIYISEAEYNYYRLEFEDVVFVYDECPVVAAGITVCPIVTPGHTLGSTCYRVGDLLFTGDTLFNEGCGACGGDGANPVQLYFSLQRLKKSISGDTRIFPAHRFHSAVGASFDDVRAMNIYLQFDRLDAFVGYRMRGGQRRNLSFL